MNDFETRLRMQEDREAIRRLKHYHYCHCVDRAVAGDAAALEGTFERFTDDIVADFTGFPLAEGKAAVTAFYAQGVPSMLSYSQHRVFNEVIDIRDDRATGLWYLDCPVVFTAASPVGAAAPGLIAGRYEEDYVREAGVWKWKKIVALLDVLAPGDSLWAEATLLRSNR